MKKVITKYLNTPLILSFILCLILMGAAIAKLTAPVAAFPDVEYAAAIFEIGLSIALLSFSSHWEMWGVAGIIFASWAGFSLFWLLWGIPCGCLGSLVIWHPGILFGMDIAFISLSIFMLRRLGAQYAQLSKILLFCLPMAILGFILAHSLYSIYF